MTNDFLETPIAKHIWDSRYRYLGDGRGDETIEDTWRRVARALAHIETKNRDQWESRFYSAIEDAKFLPAGRIQYGAGTEKEVTLFNCFVMGIIEDSMESIFEHLKEGAITMQHGGGVGYDFSTLRPEGSLARTTGRIASGVVPFMRIWDRMCATVLSTGARRGAMMATLRCDHPDIEAFADAKGSAGELTNFNVSVQATDVFMEAVDRDEDWALVFPFDRGEGPPATSATEETVLRRWTGTDGPVPCRVVRRVRARELWDRIMRGTYDYAEPGVLFTDRVNRANNLWYCEYITATNPCGEIPLPPYGACDLGSINVTAFVRDAFCDNASLNWNGIEATARVAVRMLDNVIDASRFPLPMQAERARTTRRIGLGVTGLGDALIMLGLHYATDAARKTAADIMRTICHTAYRASIDIAQEKGAFPAFERDEYLESEFIQSLPLAIREAIAADGIRNSHLLAIAPAGTISLLANNISSGIEPVYSFRQERQVLHRDGTRSTFQLEDYAYQLWKRSGRPARDLPETFVGALSIAPEDHLRMQAALQPFVDNSISKTVNVPEDYPFEDFKALYQRAYALGLKGCTTYRPSEVRGYVLRASEEPEQEQPATQAPPIHCCTIDREAD